MPQAEFHFHANKIATAESGENLRCEWYIWNPTMLRGERCQNNAAHYYTQSGGSWVCRECKARIDASEHRE